MSLRYASRFVVQAGSRATQAARGVKESATAASNSGAGVSSTRGVRRVSTSLESKRSAIAKAVADAKRKRAEESLRTVMFLSIWGPN
jgi:transposase-like protein